MQTVPLLPLENLLFSDRAETTRLALSGDTAHDFAAFKCLVSGLAAKIATQGGKDWLVACEDGWELAVCLFAVLHAGRRPVLPANHQGGHLSDVARQVEGVVGGAVADMPCLMISDADQAPPPARFDPAAAEIVLHTSGSSGRPEAFVKPFSCLQAEVKTLHATFGEGAPYTVLATVPAHHIYGLLFRVLWPLSAGWAFDAEMIRYPEEVPLRLAGHANCRLVSSPAFLKRAVEVMDWAAAQELKGIFSSGGPLAPDVAAAYNTRLTYPVREVYGSTETGGIGYRSVYDAKTPASWVPLDGVALSLDDQGRLCVTSPHIADGAFQTEDLADLYEDGSFMLKGRADRILKVEEKRISLTEIENRLGLLAEITQARCVPLQSGNRTLLGVAAVLTERGWAALCAQGKKAFTQSLRTALSSHIPPTSLPRKWRFVGALPETAQGKVTQADLQALFDPAGPRKTKPEILSEELTGNKAHLVLKVAPDLAWFDGHFDIAPVLPGLAQLSWAEDAARRLFGQEGSFERLEIVKFFEIIPPGALLNLDLTYEEEKARVLFHYSSDKADHAKGRLVFGKTS